MTRRLIRASVVALPLLAAVVWVKVYFLIPIILLLAWVYLFWNRELHVVHWFGGYLPYKVASRLRPLWYWVRARGLWFWLMASVWAVGVAWFVNAYVVSMALCTLPGKGTAVCLVNKAKYGVPCDAENIDNYYRTHRIGTIERNDMAVVRTPDGTLALRIVALPSDTVAITDGMLYRNGTFADVSGAVATFRVLDDLEYTELRALKENSLGPIDTLNHSVRMNTHLRCEHCMASTYGILLPNMADTCCYPYNVAYLWNAYQTENLRLPRKGDTLQLTYANVMLYANLISRYENCVVNVNPSLSYTFRQSYYYMLSDDRDVVNDSRIYGPIPESHILGSLFVIN